VCVCVCMYLCMCVCVCVCKCVCVCVRFTHLHSPLHNNYTHTPTDTTPTSNYTRPCPSTRPRPRIRTCMHTCTRRTRSCRCTRTRTRSQTRQIKCTRRTQRASGASIQMIILRDQIPFIRSYTFRHTQYAYFQNTASIFLFDGIFFLERTESVRTLTHFHTHPNMHTWRIQQESWPSTEWICLRERIPLMWSCTSTHTHSNCIIYMHTCRTRRSFWPSTERIPLSRNISLPCKGSVYLTGELFCVFYFLFLYTSGQKMWNWVWRSKMSIKRECVCNFVSACVILCVSGHIIGFFCGNIGNYMCDMTHLYAWH